MAGLPGQLQGRAPPPKVQFPLFILERISFIQQKFLFFIIPREEPGLQFPALSARQKQFALNPGHPEYYRLDFHPIFFKLEMIFSRERPDFLQFGLQALDDSSDPRQEAAREAEKEVGILF